jgi:hypothetical protein
VFNALLVPNIHEFENLTRIAVEEKTHASLAQASPQDAPAFQMNARPALSNSRVIGCRTWIGPHAATWLSNKGSMYSASWLVALHFCAAPLLACGFLRTCFWHFGTEIALL